MKRFIHFLAKRPLILAAILAIWTGGFYFFYLEGIPYEQEPAVSTGWIKAVHLSWPQILKQTFSPVSYSLTANDVDLTRVRVTEHLALKLIYQLFGPSSTAVLVYNVGLAVLFSLLVFFLFYKLTENGFVSFLGSVFLLATPAYGWAIMEYGDFAPLDQILLMLYFWFYVWAFHRWRIGYFDQSNRPLQAVFTFVSIWLLGMATMRGKETNLFLVTGISWLLFFFNPQYHVFHSDSKLKIRHFLPLGITLVLLTLPIIFVNHPASVKAAVGRNFFLNPIYMFLYNPGPSYAGEKFCPLLSLESKFPSTILGNFGFGLSWIILLGGIVFGIWRLRFHPKRSEASARASMVLVLSGWAIIASAFYVVYPAFYYTRYLAWLLLPFTLLVAYGFTQAIRLLHGKIKIGAILLVTSLVFLQIGENLSHSFYMRKGLERIWTPKWIFRTQIYQDRTGDLSPDFFEVHSYWYPRTDFTKAIEPFLVHHVEEVNRVAQDPKVGEVLEKFKIAYVTSNQLLNLPWKNTLIRQVDASNLSTLTRLIGKFSKKKPPTYYLYRIEPA